ncbi:MAG: CxxxxCH/CxxCH domain-containing protein [Ignavibacteriaceae bacterium]
MKLKFILKIFSNLLIIGLVVSCSKLNDPVPLTPNLTIHKKGILEKESPNWHGNLVRESSWDLKVCQDCHATDYSGGITGSSCLNCHNEPDGPEACNTCHGDFMDPSIIAPPQDTKGNVSSDSRGVGAHVAHLYQNDLGKQIPCSTCHIVPQNYFDPGHAVDDPLPAEVIFSPLAVYNIADNPMYDYSTATCSDTYCHGNWAFSSDSSSNPFAYVDSVMTGNNKSVVWNQVGTGQADCGTCHNLPPTGHLDHPACGTCHPGVVDDAGNIINPEKHIDGKINVFGN